MAKGDAAGALLPFEVTSEVAPELPQTHYAVGVALLIADFAHRERALAALGRALDAEPGNPLFQIAAVIADERRSLLRADGALYLTAEAAATLDAATARLREEKAALNGRYLAALLGEREATGDPAHPERLAGFAGMVGSQGRVRLPEWREAQPLGRLLALAIPDAQFASYEPRMVARLQNGLDSLSPENQRHLRVKARLEAVRGHFRPEPGPRS
jgi:hypothetical protein